MTNSNDPKNSGFEQSDDLIAELARIVADDAKRSTVSDAIDERAQATVASRSMPTPTQSFEQSPEVEERAEAPQPEPTFRPTLVEAKEQAPEEAFVAPVEAEPTPAVPFSTIGEGVTPVTRTEEPATPKAELQDPISPNTQSVDVPFEFDFTSNIEQGFAEKPSLIPKREESPALQASDAEPAAEEEIPAELDDLDVIASLIEDVERQSASEPVPTFDEIPVAQSGVADHQVQDNLTDTSPNFAPVPEQTAQTQRGEDEFSVPPSMVVDATDPTVAVSDPLSEIEDLIADTRTPVEQNRDDKTPADAAEAAILAALAAAGPKKVTPPIAPAQTIAATQRSPVARPSEPNVHSDMRSSADQDYASASVGTDQIRSDFGTPEEEKRGGMLPVFASVAAVLLLAIVGGVGYWVFYGQNADTDVPTVAAQNTQVKVAPETPQSTEENSSVFNALDGNAENTGNEQLVSRDDTDGASGTNVARVVTPTSSSTGLTNRKVKTVTVLADGTIVSGNEASAGAEQLPQGVRPNVPALTGGNATTETGDDIASVLNSIASGDPVTSVTPDATTLVPAITDTPTTDTTAIDDPSAPTPPARPAGLGTNQPLATAVATPNSDATTSQPISLLPQTTSAPTPTTNTSTVASSTTNGVSAPFYVQLASQRTVETAQTTAARLQRQFPSLLSNATIDINRVDLGEKGIYYRVRVPANSLTDANALCSNLKVGGGDCFVRNN
ncbi:SPOR domain-containing protein [Maritalea sp.]|uniref:SPOR domain-containing protein n=1 Tax=Maritalea sp. TaxID=2003361 RepID=UPI003EF897CD